MQRDDTLRHLVTIKNINNPLHFIHTQWFSRSAMLASITSQTLEAQQGDVHRLFLAVERRLLICYRLSITCCVWQPIKTNALQSISCPSLHIQLLKVEYGAFRDVTPPDWNDQSHRAISNGDKRSANPDCNSQLWIDENSIIYILNKYDFII